MSRDANPIAFLSYSWDSDGHIGWVRQLAADLLLNGVHVMLDQYDLRPGKDMHMFMERAVRVASHVLVICTPSYAEKANRRHSGVGEETQLITPEFYDRHRTGKEFIPVLRSGEPGSSLPAYLRALVYLDFREPQPYAKRLAEVLHVLYDVPLVCKPTPGVRPSFLRRPGSGGAAVAPDRHARRAGGGPWPSRGEGAPDKTGSTKSHSPVRRGRALEGTEFYGFLRHGLGFPDPTIRSAILQASTFEEFVAILREKHPDMPDSLEDLEVTYRQFWGTREEFDAARAIVGNPGFPDREEPQQECPTDVGKALSRPYPRG